MLELLDKEGNQLSVQDKKELILELAKKWHIPVELVKQENNFILKVN